MTHEDVRRQLLDFQRDRLPAERRREIAEHLDRCPACTRASAAEALLGELLERRLRRYPAPPALKRNLAARAAAAPVEAPPAAGAPAVPRRRWLRVVAPAMAAALAAATTFAIVERSVPRSPGALAALTSEAVNDHLRVLRSGHPVDVESGATHQVKPWFEGKLGFAPAVPAPVTPEMRLEGGSVGWFLDREAAVIVYGVRRHVVTLLAFPAEGLAWPAQGSVAVDGTAALRASSRGFHVVLWRSGGLAYALVSDMEPAELAAIAAKLAEQT